MLMRMPERFTVRNTVNGDVTGTLVQAGEIIFAGAPPVPRQLLAAPSSFVGRVSELVRLTEAPGIHVIAGIGGVGKTWLAVRWAQANRHQFPDGQLFVDLRGFSADQPMVSTVAVRGFLDALGAVVIPPEPHAQIALYRSLTADKRMLVVLDNAADAAQVEPLLPGGSACTVLVTSRRQLGALITRYGGRHLRLGALADAEAHDLLVARLGPERVATDPAAVRRILDRCAGLPLALAIVAARAQLNPDLPIARIVDELGQFEDADPATSLPSVLSWSLRVLTQTQVYVLGLLAAAPGPDIGPAAMVSLAGATSEVSVLEQLCLLERDSVGRYRMHDLIRAHVRINDVDATRRVIDHYLHSAHAADRCLYPLGVLVDLPPMSQGCQPEKPADADTALAWFDAEHQCLLSAVDVAAEQGWHDVVWHLARTLTTYHHRRDHADADLRTWGRALQGRMPNRALVTAHRRLGEAHARACHDTQALTHLRQAAVLAEQIGDLHQLSHIHRALAWTFGRQGKDITALRHAHENLRLSRQFDDPASQAHALNAVAWFTARLGDLDQARTFGESALTTRPNPEGEASCRETLGYIEHHAGRPAESVAHYQQALALRRAHGYLRHIANNLDRMAHPLRSLGRLEEAEASSREAQELFTQLQKSPVRSE